MGLLRLIKADKERHGNVADSIALSVTNNRSKTVTSSVAEPNRTQQKKRKNHKRSGRRQSIRGGVRNLRRDIRRVWRRVVTCSVTWRHHVIGFTSHMTELVETTKDVAPSTQSILAMNYWLWQCVKSLHVFVKYWWRTPVSLDRSHYHDYVHD